jgi:membrane-associated phospholipid phosphatase
VIRPAILYWMLGAAILAAVAWLVCPAGQCFVPGLDLAGLGLAHQLRNTTLDSLMTIITSFGSIWLLLPLASTGATWLWLRGRRMESGFVLLALLGATALAQLVKFWVARPRPDVYAISLPVPADLSFPSGHSMQVSALAMALFLVLARRRPEWRVSLALLLAALVVLVGLSRIYLQVHFPSDVLAGLLAGTFWVLGLHALMFPQSARCGQSTASGDSA